MPNLMRHFPVIVAALLLGLLPATGWAEANRPQDAGQNANAPHENGAAQQEPALGDLMAAVNASRWREAQTIARALDRRLGRGDVFAAYAKSAELARADRCREAETLARPVRAAIPQFGPVYHVLAHCALVRGQRRQAVAYYRQLASQVRNEQARKAILDRADRIAKSLRPRLEMDVTLVPSTNIVRQTSETQLGGGWNVSDDSRAAPGIWAGTTASVIVPLYQARDYSNLMFIRFGTGYNTARRTHHPLVGIENRSLFSLGPKSTIHAGVFYDHQWEDRESSRHRYGVKLGGARRFEDERFRLGWEVSAARQDYAEDFRDGYRVSGLLQPAFRLDGRNTITATLTAGRDEARTDRYTFTEAGIDLELEHRWPFGLYTSVAGNARYRRYDGFAALTLERQRNKALAARFGVSHERLTFAGVRPELTLTATRQWSNDVFNDYSALDAGLRFKRGF